MPQALPSFVELLDSLDLEGEETSEVQPYAHYPALPSFVTSPSSSPPSPQASPGKLLTSPELATHFFNISRSPSIVISHPSPVTDDFTTSRRRSISNRYNPYDHQNLFTRRRSLPGDLSNYTDRAHQPPNTLRAGSASPPIAGRRASLGHLSDEQSTQLTTKRITRSKEDQPISAFARRRQPYSFPAKSTEYRKPTRRSVSPTDPLAPVSLPSLPPLPRISTVTDSLAPSLSDTLRPPSISVLGHSSTSTSEHHDPRPRAMARTSTPPFYNHAHDHRNNTMGHPR